MPVISPLRTSRALLAFAAVLLPATVVPSASAAVVTHQGACARTVDVVQWAPRKGAVARFIADRFASSSNTGLWIGLGRTDTAFWSAEGGDPNDACDDCRTLSLVETRFDGTRTRHGVLTTKEHERIGADASVQKAHILAALWKLARRTWPADKLKQDYALAAGKPSAKNPAGDPPFVVEVSTKGKGKIRYDLTARTSMCWCVYDWKAKGVPTVRPPAK